MATTLAEGNGAEPSSAVDGGVVVRMMEEPSPSPVPTAAQEDDPKGTSPISKPQATESSLAMTRPSPQPKAKIKASASIHKAKPKTKSPIRSAAEAGKARRRARPSSTPPSKVAKGTASGAKQSARSPTTKSPPTPKKVESKSEAFNLVRKAIQFDITAQLFDVMQSFRKQLTAQSKKFNKEHRKRFSNDEVNDLVIKCFKASEKSIRAGMSEAAPFDEIEPSKRRVLTSTKKRPSKKQEVETKKTQTMKVSNSDGEADSTLTIDFSDDTIKNESNDDKKKQRSSEVGKVDIKNESDDTKLNLKNSTKAISTCIETDTKSPTSTAKNIENPKRTLISDETSPFSKKARHESSGSSENDEQFSSGSAAATLKVLQVVADDKFSLRVPTPEIINKHMESVRTPLCSDDEDGDEDLDSAPPRITNNDKIDENFIRERLAKPRAHSVGHDGGVLMVSPNTNSTPNDGQTENVIVHVTDIEGNASDDHNSL